MLRALVEFSPAIVLLQVVIAALALALSLKRRSLFYSLTVFFAAYAVANFIFLIILPLPLKFDGPRPEFIFASQFEGFDIGVFFRHFPEVLARDKRYLTVPFLMAFFCPFVMPRLRKPLGGLYILAAAETFYLSANLLINTVSRRVMTPVSAGKMIFIAFSVSAGVGIYSIVAFAKDKRNMNN